MNDERIPTDPFQWKVKPRGALQLAATLVERRDDAFLYRKLATLVETVPLQGSLEHLRFPGVPRVRFVSLPKISSEPEFEPVRELTGTPIGTAI